MRASELKANRKRAKEMLRALGLSTAEWARQNGFNVDHVYHVLNNNDVRAHYGEMHRIAVALGMKPAPPEISKPQIAA